MPSGAPATSVHETLAWGKPDLGDVMCKLRRIVDKRETIGGP